MNPNKPINIYTKSSIDERYYEQVELPINFSNIILNLYGCGIVSQKHIKQLSNLGIETLINLIGEESPKELIKTECKKFNINLLHYGLKDKSDCEFETFLKIQEIINSNIECKKKCLVHCKGGIGRTNMILAGYLIKYNNIAPAESIGILKKTRKVIMVPEQINILKKYYSYLINLNSSNDKNNDKNNDNKTKLLPKNLKGLLIMMGLPCSGKSTLSLEIFSAYSLNPQNKIIHLNQDEIGKASCENLLSLQAKYADLIIMDRCNPLSSDRTHWINLYRGLIDKKITLIFFNLGLNLSLERLESRKNHLTLGITGGNIIKEMHKKITIPKKDEGWDELIIIDSIDKLNEFKKNIGLNVNNNCQKININENFDLNHMSIDKSKIIKFPRTKHIINLGAMSRDDLQMDKKDIDNMLSGEIIVEEKIDGANLGFRLDLLTNKILAQNRSHYVSSSYHLQFKKLDEWIETNKFGLIKILSGGNYIIYGEWLYSKHSIHYTNLPDYFIMFDLYDIDNNTFFSRDFVEKLIDGTKINLVPLIYRGKATIEKLKNLAQSKSNYYDGVVEGIYVRSNDIKTNKLKLRAKIVRSDFISGNELWTKGKQILNIISNNKN